LDLQQTWMSQSIRMLFDSFQMSFEAEKFKPHEASSNDVVTAVQSFDLSDSLRPRKAPSMAQHSNLKFLIGDSQPQSNHFPETFSILSQE
jgi:hypothetical protein